MQHLEAGDEKVERPWPDHEKGPWVLETLARPVAGRYEIVGLSIRPMDDYPSTPLTSTVLRRLVPSRMSSEHRVHMGAHASAMLNAAGPVSEKTRAAFLSMFSAGEPEHQRVGRPAYWDGQRLVDIARAYDEAWTRREPPTQAVAERFHISRSHAGKLVARCRDRGLLPPTDVGRARGSARAHRGQDDE